MRALYQAVCWTLLHSLWQALIIAFAAGMIMLFAGKSSVKWRYRALLTLFLVFIVTVCITFITELQQVNITAGSAIHITTTYPIYSITQKNYAEKIIDYVNANSTLFVIVWFILFSAKCISLLSGLVQINRLRNHRTYFPADAWKDRMQELAVGIGIHRTIVLLESALIQVPLVIGWLKPAVLIPLGMLTNLPQDEIEAILLHELAHIKRKDFIINLLQNFSEVIFFFNPGLLWLSSLIRDERENCCDDLAIGVTKNKTGFISALTSFYQYNQVNRQVLSFSGNNRQLLNRVKRIAYNSSKALSQAEKTLMGCTFLILFLLVSAFIKSPAKSAVSEVSVAANFPFVENKMIDSSPPKSKQYLPIKYAVVTVKPIVSSKSDSTGQKQKSVIISTSETKAYSNTRTIIVPGLRQEGIALHSSYLDSIESNKGNIALSGTTSLQPVQTVRLPEENKIIITHSPPAQKTAPLAPVAPPALQHSNSSG